MTTEAPAESQTKRKLPVRRVIDLVVIGIFAFALLGLGWKLTAKDDAPTREELQKQSTGVIGKPIAWDDSLSIRWGNRPFALQRSRFRGDETQAITELAKLVEQSMEFAKAAGEPTKSEKQLLLRLTENRPVAEKKGGWRIDAVAGPVLLVSGVRMIANEPRVVCWGFGLPDKEHWTLLVFRGTEKNASLVSGWPKLQSPPGGQIFLELRTPDGGGLMGLRLPGSSRSAVAFVTDAMSKADWKTDAGWRETAGGLSARFAANAGAIEVAIREAKTGQNVLFRFLPHAVAP